MVHVRVVYNAQPPFHVKTATGQKEEAFLMLCHMFESKLGKHFLIYATTNHNRVDEFTIVTCVS